MCEKKEKELSIDKQIEPPEDIGGPKKYSNKQLKDALYMSMGNVTRAAKLLKVHPSGIWRKINLNKEKWYEIMEDARRQVFSLAEAALIKKIKEGDTRAIIYVMRTLGLKYAGYVERQEITGADGVDLYTNVKIEIVKKNESA